MVPTTRSTTLSKKFCSCIKKVRKTLKIRVKGKTKADRDKKKEGIAIAICTKSVLQTRRGRTLKRFKCTPKPFLQTQKLLS